MLIFDATGQEQSDVPPPGVLAGLVPGVVAGVLAGVEAFEDPRLEFGVFFSDDTPREARRVDSATVLDTVSTVLSVEDRLGIGKPLKP